LAVLRFVPISCVLQQICNNASFLSYKVGCPMPWRHPYRTLPIHISERSRLRCTAFFSTKHRIEIIYVDDDSKEPTFGAHYITMLTICLIGRIPELNENRRCGIGRVVVCISRFHFIAKHKRHVRDGLPTSLPAGLSAGE
jgi:hypothetical protein